MYISSCVFGRLGYILKDIVAHNQAKFQHPMTFGRRDIAFDAYPVILIGGIDLKLFVGGVNDAGNWHK